MSGWSRALWALVATGFLFAFSTREAHAEPPDPLTVEWCLAEAERANPDIAVDQAEAEAASHRVGPAGALDDPRVQYEAVNVPTGDFSFNATPMSGNQIRLAQRFPFPGVLGNRKGAAKSAAAAAFSDLTDRRRRVLAAAERTFARLGFAQRALEITNRNIDFLRQLNRIAEAKYEVGKGLQQDVLRAQVELTRLLDERLRRERDITNAAAALNGLLDRPAPATYPRTENIVENAPLPNLATLIDRLEETSPRLFARRQRIEAADRLRRAAIRESYPDFDLGLGYRVRQSAPGDPVRGDDFVSAGITIRLPVNRGKWREVVAERKAMVRRARAAYRAEYASLRAGLRAAYAELERADGQQDLLETGLVPQARQSLESSRSGYQVDKVDFLSLVDSQLRLLDAELSLVRAQADRRSAYAALEEVFGESLR